MSTPTRVYVGASTRASRHGITVFRLEPGATSISRASVVDDIANPTFLAPHPDGRSLYAVSETDAGQVVALRVEDDDLVVDQIVPTGGDGPCHLSTDGRHLVVADYGSGSAAAFRLDVDGRITERVWTRRHRGRGPHWRQDAPHAHCAVLDPRRASVWVVDLGIDLVVRYDAVDGGFRHGAEVALAPGAGPRHLAFHPSGSIAFVVCELDNTVTVVDVGTDHPERRGSVSTLPTDHAGESLAAAVVVHPSGDRVYASNRGHDSIAVFAHDLGTLVPLGHVPSGGEGPRDLAIDPSGTLLLAANQRSGAVAGFDVSGPGMPRPLGVLAHVDEPTCVAMVGAVS